MCLSVTQFCLYYIRCCARVCFWSRFLLAPLTYFWHSLLPLTGVILPSPHVDSIRTIWLSSTHHKHNTKHAHTYSVLSSVCVCSSSSASFLYHIAHIIDHIAIIFGSSLNAILNRMVFCLTLYAQLHHTGKTPVFTQKMMHSLSGQFGAKNFQTQRIELNLYWHILLFCIFIWIFFVAVLWFCFFSLNLQRFVHACMCRGNKIEVKITRRHILCTRDFVTHFLHLHTQTLPRQIEVIFDQLREVCATISHVKHTTILPY